MARRGRFHDADACFGAIGRRRPDVYLREFIMPTKSIAVPDDVYERVQQIAAAEGTTVDQLATKAIERDLARRWLDRIGREGDQRRGDLSDAEVEAVVEQAVQESRTRS
jgi:predicted transcriptional regulator